MCFLYTLALSSPCIVPSGPSSRNVVKDLLLSGQQGLHGWASCLFWNDTNCARRNGRYYEAMRTKYYDTPDVNKVRLTVERGKTSAPCATERRVAACH